MYNWEWPQWLLAGWWAFSIGLGLILMMAPSVKMNYQKFAMRIIDVIVLSAILYAGGFWS